MTRHLLIVDQVASSMKKQQASINGSAQRIKLPQQGKDDTSEGSAAHMTFTPPASPSIPQHHQPSKTIPLPSSHVHRTQSELQLCQDMEVAEMRDASMFNRLVNGIRVRQMELDQSYTESPYPYARNALQVESERSIANIINTRNTPLDETPIRALENVRSTLPTTINNNGVLQQERTGYAEDWSVCGFEQPQVPLVGGYETRCPPIQSSYPTQQYYQESPARELDRYDTNVDANDDGEEEIFCLDM